MKHTSERKKRGKSALPDPGSYQPESGMFTSFGKMFAQKQSKNKEEGNLKKNVALIFKFNSCSIGALMNALKTPKRRRVNSILSTLDLANIR
jgi:hypothetical protein